MRYWFEWFKGRWHILSGDLEQAAHHYEQAIELASYRVGTHQRTILEEALVLAGALRNKKFVAKMKQQAIALGLLRPPQQQDAGVVEDWEMKSLEDQFSALFPSNGLFPEASQGSIFSPRFSGLTAYSEDWDRHTPDLRNPDRIFKVKYGDNKFRRRPQIEQFAIQGDIDAVKKLLDKGADVNKLDEQGGSALLCALQRAENINDRSVLDVLIAIPHKPETLNSLTEKKRISPLFVAIEYGDPDVVESILKIGANPNIIGKIECMTPIHYCFQFQQTDPKKRSIDSLKKMLSNNLDATMKDTIRRHGIGNIFGENTMLKQLLNNPIVFEIHEEVIQHYARKHRDRHTPSRLIRIIKLLLDYGANPNSPTKYPVPGRTPMMLAAEFDLAAVFDLILQNGGDPFLKDSQGSDCIKIANSFDARAVRDYMRSKGIG